MTSKVVNVANGDYKVIVRDSGSITLDTGEQGTTIITGNLEVRGDTTYVYVSDMQVEDNTIILNVNGGSASGIPTGGIKNGRSGLEITRGGTGEFADAWFMFDETVKHIYLAAEKNGTFVFKRNTGGDGELAGIQTCHINSKGQDLFLLVDPDNPDGDGVITVSGMNAYERNVLDYAAWDLIPPTGPIVASKPDAIPNVQAVVDFLNSQLAFLELPKIKEANTIVEVFDAQGPLSPYRPTGYTAPTDSTIDFTVDGVLKGQFTVDGLNVDNVRILTNTVANTDASSDLILSALNSNIKVDGYLNLADQTTAPTSTSGVNKVYSKDTLGMGKSGVFFVNTTTSDELVSRRRALGFSMIF